MCESARLQHQALPHLFPLPSVSSTPSCHRLISLHSTAMDPASEFSLQFDSPANMSKFIWRIWSLNEKGEEKVQIVNTGNAARECEGKSVQVLFQRFPRSKTLSTSFKCDTINTVNIGAGEKKKMKNQWNFLNLLNCTEQTEAARLTMGEPLDHN